MAQSLKIVKLFNAQNECIGMRCTNELSGRTVWTAIEVDHDEMAECAGNFTVLIGPEMGELEEAG